MPSGYLIDTNHLSAAVRPGSSVRESIRTARRQGLRLGSCLPFLCELEVGIQQVGSPEAYRKLLVRLLSEIRIWPLDLATCQLYGGIYLELRGKGRILSQVDMMLAALARRMDLTILTTDRDFEAFSDIHTEDWTRP